MLGNSGENSAAADTPQIAVGAAAALRPPRLPQPLLRKKQPSCGLLVVLLFTPPRRLLGLPLLQLQIVADRECNGECDAGGERGDEEGEEKC